MNQSLMSKTPDTTDALGDVLNIGQTLDINLVTPDIINVYAQNAEREFDNTISQLYVTPLKRIADVEMKLITDFGEYDAGDVAVLSNEATVLIPGDVLVVTDGVNQDEVVVLSVDGTVVTLVSPVMNTYEAANTRVVRLDYPAAIKFICTRLACANIFDRYFSAQADKNESKYGQFLRSQANKEMNKILAGVTILHGIPRQGTLTVNPNLIKAYGLQKGWNDQPYKMDDLGKT